MECTDVSQELAFCLSKRDAVTLSMEMIVQMATSVVSAGILLARLELSLSASTVSAKDVSKSMPGRMMAMENP